MPMTLTGVLFNPNNALHVVTTNLSWIEVIYYIGNIKCLHPSHCGILS